MGKRDGIGVKGKAFLGGYPIIPRGLEPVILSLCSFLLFQTFMKSLTTVHPFVITSETMNTDNAQLLEMQNKIGDETGREQK